MMSSRDLLYFLGMRELGYLSEITVLEWECQ
jgi:hypothetical protein